MSTIASRTRTAAASARLGVLMMLVTVLFLSLIPADQAAAAGKKPGRGKQVTATLVALPPIVAPGTKPTSPSTTGSLLATFSPARPGQKVVLEKKVGKKWKVVGTGREDAWGSAAFSPKLGIYRARTTSRDGRTWATGAVVTKGWAPAFSDTFDGSTLNTSVWNDQKREHESVYAPRTCARTSPAARRVEGGVLHLGVAPDPEFAGQTCNYVNKGVPGTSTYMLNSQVATENTHLFRHGIVAARIKPQRSKGMHSGLWMLPAGTKYVDGEPAGGTEIDVMEFFGENGRNNEGICTHIHYYEANWQKVSMGDSFASTRKALSRGKNWWDEFHVFSVEWTAKEYIFRIDGREYYREAKAVSQVPQYLVLSNLTSDYELKNLTPAKFGDTAQVDWVQVFDATSFRASRTTMGKQAS